MKWWRAPGTPWAVVYIIRIVPYITLFPPPNYYSGAEILGAINLPSDSDIDGDIGSGNKTRLLRVYSPKLYEE